MTFKDIVDAMFAQKTKWVYITNKDKEEFFFIFNRFMSKQYPKQANYFNDKTIDKASAMDIWFSFLKSEVRTPYWFWKGATKKKAPVIKDWKLIEEYYEASIEDIYYWCEMFPDDVKSEIKRIKKIPGYGK